MAAVLQEQYDEAPFRGIHDALKFALNFKHGNTKEPTIARFQKSSHGGRGLGGLDGAGQAGLILASLEEMGADRRSLLIARFTDAMLACSCKQECCSGFKENKRWGDAVNVLAEYVLVNATGSRISHFRLRRASVMRYFGVRKSFAEIAARCGVKADTASAHHNKAVQCLAELEKIARYEIEDRLRKGGVIE